MKRPVLNKQDFYRRFFNGEFGNHGLMWQTLAEYRESRYPHEVVIRTKTPGGLCQYDVSPQDVSAVWRRFRERYNEQDLVLNAAMPARFVLLNAEVSLTPAGLYVFGSTEPGHMRPSLAASGQHHFGLAANQLLRSRLCPGGYDWLMELLDGYPGHVVELTALNRTWGWHPGGRTVFWEVRNF